MEKVVVNGALIEREFLEDNVREARACAWRPLEMAGVEEHRHCVVCGIALPSPRWTTCYTTGSLFLCAFCATEFVLARNAGS